MSECDAIEEEKQYVPVRVRSKVILVCLVPVMLF